MITHEQFETGLRLDQYISSIAQNKENFRANFIKAIEAYNADDVLFFRSLKEKIYVAVVTDDDSYDALRDVPLISRISVEVGRLALRLFRPSTHAEMAAAVALAAGIEKVGFQHLPVIALFSSSMELLGAHVRRLSAMDDELRRRHSDWVQAHPEVADAAESFEKMTPITRTRVTQALFALTGEQRLDWGRRTVRVWRQIIAQSLQTANGAHPTSPAPHQNPPLPTPPAPQPAPDTKADTL